MESSQGSHELFAVHSLKERIRKEFAGSNGYDNGIEILRLGMQEDHKDTHQKVRSLSLGVANSKAYKVILLVGATGGGKTTLINTMVNYIFGVDFADSFRFIVSSDDMGAPGGSQGKKQTHFITAYVFNYLAGMPLEYNYILIDTPGFGDARGIQRDRETMEQLRAFFESDSGVSHVDCIGLVVPSSESRLTHAQRYVIEGISSMFGKDVSNIFVLATFSDGGPPAVTETLKAANLAYERMYKFNNSALFASNSADHASDMDKHNWAMNINSMTDLFCNFDKIFPVSLNLTIEVLRSQSHLQSCLAALNALIHIGLEKMVILEKEKAMLMQNKIELKDWENHDKDIERHENSGRYFRFCLAFDLVSVVRSIVKLYLSSARALQSHLSSSVKGLKSLMMAIDYGRNPDGPYQSLEDGRTKRTIKQLVDQCRAGIIDKQQVIEAIEEDTRKISNRLILLIAQSQAHEQMLKNICLKQNSFSVKDHIDLMIHVEKNQQGLSWEKRVEKLKQLRKDSEELDAVSTRGTIGPKLVDQLREFSELCI